MKKILLDTDVILDVFLERKNFVKKSREILSLCDQKKINDFVTPVIVANVHYLLSRGIGKKRALETVSELTKLAEILSMDGNTVSGALRSDFRDFEDALQNQAAETAKLDMILTRNTKDYKKSALAVMEPEEFLKAF